MCAPQHLIKMVILGYFFYNVGGRGGNQIVTYIYGILLPFLQMGTQLVKNTIFGTEEIVIKAGVQLLLADTI